MKFIRSFRIDIFRRPVEMTIVKTAVVTVVSIVILTAMSKRYYSKPAINMENGIEIGCKKLVKTSQTVNTAKMATISLRR